MITEEGYEISTMSKEEAKASVKEMGNMMDYFEEICEHCNGKRMDCSQKCLDLTDNSKTEKEDENGYGIN